MTTPSPKTLPSSIALPSQVKQIAAANSSAGQLAQAGYHGAAIAGNNVKAAWAYANGRGTTAAVIDQGFDPSQFNDFSAALSSSFGTGTYLAPTTAYQAMPTHGQLVSAVLASTDTAWQGPAGVAPDANLVAAGINYGTSSQSDYAAALSYAVATGKADVVNCSWGLSGFYGDTYSTSYLQPWFAAVGAAVAQGRGGLGASIVFAASNDRAHANNVGLHAQQDDPRVIAVAGTGADGSVAGFSTAGAGLLTAAAGMNDQMLANGTCWSDSGTSFAAPTVSGIISLMYSVNPNLGWRDVQEIIAAASYAPAASAAGFVANGATGWNGGGMHFSDDLGFGLLDADVAVNLAKVWTATMDSGNLATATAASSAPLALTGTGSTGASALAFAQSLRVEHVQVTLGASTLPVADARLVLISPDGTQSVLLNEAGLEDVAGTRVAATIAAGAANVQDGTNGMTLGGLDITSNAFWGENSAGTWTLQIQDVFGNDVGSVANWSLTVLGDTAGAQALPLVYTPEFASLAAASPARALVTNGGNLAIRTIDLMALDQATSINLNGGKGLIDGVAVTVQAGFLNAQADGSTGNVTLTGTAGNNVLTGGDGNTVINGGGGNDTITAGFGATAVTTGAGRSTVNFAATLAGGNSTLLSGGTDTVTAGAGALAVTVGGTAFDAIHGSTGALAVNLSGKGSAQVTGGSGNLALNETGGTAVVTGGAGSATIKVTAGALTWHGGAGALSFIGGTSAVAISGGSGQEIVTMGSGGGTFAGGSAYVNYTGGSGNEVITAGSASSVYQLGSGHTVFTGGSALVNVSGGQGSAIITGGSGGGNFTAGRGGNSVLTAGSGACQLHGTAAGDRLVASSAGGDKLYAGSGAETLTGAASKAGNSFYDGSGMDTFIGGAGADTFNFLMGRGAWTDIINNFDIKHDLLAFAGYGSGAGAYAYANQASDGHGGTIVSMNDELHIDVAGVAQLAQNLFA